MARSDLPFGSEFSPAQILQLDRQTLTDLRPLLRKPLGEIRREMRSNDRRVRGLALEALACKLMRFVDRTYVGTRLRGGAEASLIFESARSAYSRWQVQCKNTDRVSIDDVAKEVGLTDILHSNVVVIVSTGTIGGEARRYANTIMTKSNLCIIMIDGDDLGRIEARHTAVVEVFNRESRHAMNLKKLERQGIER